jgi:hypothetical protein
MLVLAGCVEVAHPAKVSGELGNGSFAYLCVDGTDPMCPDGGLSVDFPDVIALGSTFQLAFHSDVGPKPVHSGSDHLVESYPPGTFQAVAPGWASVVAGEEDEVYDLVHVWVAASDQLQLSADLELAVDEISAVQVTSLCQGAVCGGALPYDWSTSDPTVVRLSYPLLDDVVSVRALAPGSAVIRVSEGQRSTAVTIAVDGGGTGTTVTTGTTGSTGSGGSGASGGSGGSTGSTGDTGSTGSTSSTGDTGGTP